VYAGSSDAVVDEANNSFTAFCHMEGRARNHSVLANPSGLAKIWVDLRLGLIDVHFVVINSSTVRGKGSVLSLAWLQVSLLSMSHTWWVS
jgi:hypothetical protein